MILKLSMRIVLNPLIPAKQSYMKTMMKSWIFVSYQYKYKHIFIYELLYQLKQKLNVYIFLKIQRFLASL